MTQKLLHLADIGSARQQMGGEGVAEGVRAYLLVDACTQGRLLYDGEYHPAREARASVIQEKRILAAVCLALLLVELDAVAGKTTHGHKTLLVALADDADVALTEEEVAQLQVAQLRYAQSA